MTITVTWQMVAWLIALAAGWTGFLLGGVRWLLSRQVKSFEDRLVAAEATASSATLAVTTHKQETTVDIAKLRLEVNTKFTCGNHQRMEENDREIYQTIRSLHGDIRELAGGVKGLTQTLKMVEQHLIKENS